MKTMKFYTGLLSAFTFVARVRSQDGPHGPVTVAVDPSLPSHTVYSPGGDAGALPILVWGNGACSADGTSVQGFLSQIASHGYLVISQGTPGASGSTTAAQMDEAVTWAANGANGGFNVDTGRIMTAGYSCGGTEAYEFAGDSRVSSIGILNSGLLGNYELVGSITKPMIFSLGGPDDIAYGNGERDYAGLPDTTAAWKGNVNSVGHGGTYYDTNGGLYATAMVNWLNWLFKADQAGRTYLESEAAGGGWSDVVHQSFDSVTVPIGACKFSFLCFRDKG